MAQLYVNKQAAAMRQLNAAIRILFAGEDALAVHTITAAVHEVLTSVDHKSSDKSGFVYLETLDSLQEQHPKLFSGFSIKDLKKLVHSKNRSGANFLKHADKDPDNLLDTEALTTDHMLLEACTLYSNLGFDPSIEMQAFARWHLSVYPSAESDRIKTQAGDVNDLDRSDQLDFGDWLLTSMRETSEVS